MLLTEKAIANIKINKVDVDLKFDFRVIENLYYGLIDEVVCKRLKIKNNISPLDLLSELDKEYNEGYLALIIYAACNGSYSIDIIETELNGVDEDDKRGIYFIFKTVIVQSLVFIEKKYEKKVDNSKKDNKKNEVDFEDWFNYYYTMSIDKLKMTLEQFYNSTASQIKERIYRVNVDKKNTYISAYVEVMKARNSSENGSNKEVEEVSSMHEFMDKMGGDR